MTSKSPLSKNGAFLCTFGCMKKLFLILLLIPAVFASAQLPGFEIYLMDLSNEAIPVNITNHEGYDNQPSFSPDGKYIYFSSFHDTIQSDIYRYALKNKQTTQVTHTTESEYSPEVTPDKKHFSVVRVEVDTSQRFCIYDLNGENHQLMLDSVQLIGYYGRLDNDWIAMFVLPEPFSLQLANLHTNYIVNIDTAIGRCLRKIPGEKKFSYLFKGGDSVWTIYEADFYQAVYESGDKKEITKIPAVSEDYAWSPDGSRIYMARGSKLFYFDYKGDCQWHEYADLGKSGIKKIYRLAISPDGKKMVFVAEE